MARLFSININFENKEYTALVSLREADNNLYCSVRYIDKGLHYIIPGDCIEFSLQEGLQQPEHLPNELAQSLVRSTSAALQNHAALKHS